jgi:hypothetical protein
VSISLDPRYHPLRRRWPFTLSFSCIRCAIDILRGRLPGALAMLKADDISISVHSGGESGNRCQIIFWFNGDGPACGNAYRAIERIYEMNRIQCDLAARPL